MNTSKLPQTEKGFTLIELMIVIGIISLLAAITYPSYVDSTRKSKRADARIALVEAAARQERAYTQGGSYLGNSDIKRLVTNSDGKSSPDGYYAMSVDTSSCSSDGSCFTITATAQGGQASDTECKSLSLNHLGQKTSKGGGDCW